jgi:hypothetical protein
MGVSMNLVFPISFMRLYQQCLAIFSGVDRKVGYDRCFCNMLGFVKNNKHIVFPRNLS